MVYYIFNWTSFCGADFSVIDSDEKHLSFCFQKGILLPVVFGLFAIFSAYYTGYQTEWVVRNAKQLLPIYARICVSALCIILTVLEPLLQFYIVKKTLFWVDTFSAGFQIICWLVHLGYLAALKIRITIHNRGAAIVNISWIFILLYSIYYTGSVWYYESDESQSVKRSITVLYIVLQGIYLCSLLPCEDGSTSGYCEISRERALLDSETTSSYSRFHIDADLLNLGIAEKQVNFLSYLFFYWVNPLMKKGALGSLKTIDDLFELPLYLKSENVFRKFYKIFIQESSKFSNSGKGPSLFKILRINYGVQFIKIGILKFIGDGLAFTGPLLLHKLVTYVDDKNATAWEGCMYTLILVASTGIGSLCIVHFNYLMAKLNVQLRASLISVVYRKIQNLSICQLNQFNSGQIINMMSTDTDRIVNLAASFHALWSLPLQMGVALYLLYRQIGIAFLAGVGLAVLLIPINKLLASKIGNLTTDMMKFKDKRVGFMKELLSMIKMVKLNAWEDIFMNKILDERFGEVKALAGTKYLDAACVYFWATTPVLIPVVTFGCFIVLGNSLNPANVFTAIALFNMLNMPFNAFPWVINGLVEAFVSLRRIGKLIEMPSQDLSKYYTVVPELSDSDVDLQVLIRNGSFTWDYKDSTSTTQSSYEFTSNTDEDMLADSELSSEYRQKKVMFDHSQIEDESTSYNSKIYGLSFQILKGQIVAITGSVGSGKSSLLHAIIGSLDKIDGIIAVADLSRGFGYASQDAWIQNISIKDNILFGNSLDASKYRDVLHACCLESDLKAFPFKDETLCGENGAALSGGQRARIALARAVYQSKNIYILDNVLSAVDAPVARHIMQHCIHRYLKDKTVVFTSHYLSLLSQVNWIINMQNGMISEQGSPSILLPKLLGEEDVTDLNILDAVDQERKFIMETKDSQAVFIHYDDDSPELSHSGFQALIPKEERIEGSIEFSTCQAYVKAAGIGLSCVVIIALLCMQASRNFTDVWLARWVSAESSGNGSSFLSYRNFISNNSGFGFLSTLMYGNEQNKQSVDSDPLTNFYFSVYCMLAAANSVFALARAFLFAYGGICAAVVLHKKLVHAILYCELSFFNFIPLGRILNRFSSDLFAVDDSLPFQMNLFFAQILGLIGSLIITLYGFVWIILLYIPLAFVYYTFQKYYRFSSREIKRMYAISLSPLYAHFTETIQGLCVIKALRGSTRFNELADRLLEHNQRAQYGLAIISQWLNIRLQFIGTAVLAGVTLLAVFQKQFDVADAGLVGLVVSYALAINGYLNAVVTSLTDTEKEMISVERINEYIVRTIPERRVGTYVPYYGWPNYGYIKFSNVYLRYQDYNPYSLIDVSFDILPAEKIGIIGRTGAGKTSIFMTLFRLVELTKGSIFIDDVDISMVSLPRLRSCLSIISQDTLIFSGSIRENLDPSGSCDDTQVWDALNLCQLVEVVNNVGGLDAPMGEAGQVLSAGESQLFCLARAFLSKNKILCIDEGTAYLDSATDFAIQKALRCAFRHRTLLIIAHRINTVRDCDKIVVMNGGRVVEWGTPQDLLSKDDSMYSYILSSQ